MLLGLMPPAAAELQDPSVSIADTTSGESGNMTFTITLSQSQAHAITVEYDTTDATALPGLDYTTTKGSVTFNPGDTTKQVNVPILTDSMDENDEYFLFFVTKVVGANLGDVDAKGTITDDDAPPTLSINDVPVTEGNSGETNGTITVTLSAPSGKIVAVDYSTANGTATTTNFDYAERTGHLAFQLGQTTKAVPITLLGDTNDEPNETFTYQLTNVSNATLGDAQGTVTIVDDDTAPGPQLSIDDVLIVEGNTGSKIATLTVTLSEAAPGNVSVQFQTADGTATFAGGDYSQHSGSVTFTAGQTSKTIEATVLGDNFAESDEQFFYNLSSPSGATIADTQGIVAILDDDGGSNVSVTVTDVTVSEGDSGTTPATVTISLSGASENLIEVDYETEDGSATFDDADYNSRTGTLAFNAGVTSRTLDINIVGDETDEDQEFLFLNISNATGGASIADPLSKITINDDDDGGPFKEDSALSIFVTVGRKIKVQGSLVPARPGDAVLLELFVKRNGVFKLIDTKAPVMGSAFTDPSGNEASPFLTRFTRPNSGRKCRLKASWPGEDAVEAAKTRSTFLCR